MRNTKWIYRAEKIKKDNINLDSDIVQILYNRGIENNEEIDIFINGTLENLIDPFKMKDMRKAVERVLLAKNNNEKIWIYGDYDVDGITSTSLCFLALKEIGINVEYYIPLRDEGYGLNKNALKYIKDQGGDLVITVDCGISSRDEIDYANELGLDVIITDHHEINNEMPKAHSVINPKREDNEIDYKYFAGVGTAYMLMFGIYITLDRKTEIYKYLDIVAIGTIADIVPLKGQNRILVKRGLELLKSSKWLGLNMLLKNLYENPMDKKFDTYDVGFIIAPIFNAAGRLEDAKMAVELFVSDDHVKCTNLIFDLIGKNSERKEIQSEILEKAEIVIEKKELDKDQVIVVAEEKFHHGVIGIVASKILDKYYKPTIIMEIKPEEGIATASCRSTEFFNMIEALKSMEDYFVKYGGHAGAAGFSIEIDKIEGFIESINNYAKLKLDENDKKKPIKVDCELSMMKISYDMMDKLSLLEPYGFGNASPLFVMKDCSFSNFRAIGKDKTHTMFNIIKNGTEIKNAVWFNSSEIIEKMSGIDRIDIAFKLKMETYKDKYQYKIFIEDVKESKESASESEYEILKNIKFPIKSVFYTRRNLESEKIGFNNEDEDMNIYIGRNKIGFLDFQTKELLKKLKLYYNYDFNIKTMKIEKKDENYNVFIEIEKNNEFKTLSFEKGNIFKDIKQFLIGDLPYNSIQKKVLSKIFKSNEKLNVVMEKGRGIKTIIKTISLYYNTIGRKVLIVTKENYIIKDREIKSSYKYEDGYDFYIYFGNEKIENLDNYNLIINDMDNIKSEFIKIIDNYKIVENIKIINDEKGNKSDIQVYCNNLPRSIKKDYLNKINTNKEVVGTEEIKILL